MGIKSKRMGPRPMPRLDCTVQELFKFRIEFYRSKSSLRLGQAIWNRFGVGSRSWPELFYCTDANEAMRMACAEVKHIDNGA